MKFTIQLSKKDSTVLAYIMKLLNVRHNYRLNLVLLFIDEGITGYRDDSLETVKQNQKDYKNNYTFCGVFRRQTLDRGAIKLGCNLIVTGHNADDIAETILMNTGSGDNPEENVVPRFKYSYEKEIVMYGYFKKLHYFSTECIYASNAYRGHVRSYLGDLESIHSSVILDVIHSGEVPPRCSYISSQRICKACVMLLG
uniref:Uncharacterized protein n=1 Tax=Tetranychus urticae TaxID=32264 RepID=T1L0I6_TETUR